MKKISFTSLGCSRNLVDTEVMIGIVLKHGYELTADLKKADFLIVNTCGFLQEARDEALGVLQNIFDVKKKNAKVIVTGCMVEKFQDLLRENFPEIFYYLGPGNLDDILVALGNEKGESITQKSYLESSKSPRFISTKSYAYLKIAEGCSKSCSYCLIPKIKGPLKSKPKKQIVEEFKKLLDQGISEVVLIAQDLGDYGKDFKEKNALENLLKELLKIKKDFWLRLLYLYPDSLSNELIQIMKSDKRICHYIDMPIQHINDEILKKMRRKTSKDQILKLIDSLRENIPDIVIRTTLIVGFPGETEEQFSELANFLKEAKLDHVGIFKFSKEEGTSASKMEDQISDKIKQNRFEKLYKIQKKIVHDKNTKMIGKELKVFIEKTDPDTNLLMGRYFGQAPDVDSCVIVSYSPIVDSLNKPYLVKILSSNEYDLVGKALKKL